MKLKLILLLVITALLAACGPNFQHPISELDVSGYDSAILGTWISKKGKAKTILNIARMDTKDAHYYVNLIQVNEGNIEMSMTFVGHGSKIEGKSFLNLIMVPDMSSSMIFGDADMANVKLQKFRKYGYFIVRYNATGNTFSYARADINKIVAEIKAGNLNGKVLSKLVGTSFKLYDDKATIAQYLVNNADSVFTDDRATFRRIAN